MKAALEQVDFARDRALVERYQAGDHTAFDDLYFRYFPLIRSFCQRHLRNAHDAEEVAQETFVRALGALPRFAGEQRLYPWLTVIARRLCIDHQRRHQRVEASDTIEVAVPDPLDQRIDDEVELAHLQVALARVQARHREVLRLRDFQELTYEAIAAELGVRVGTVQSLLHRARGALRREFQAVAGTLGALPPVTAGWGWLRRSWRRAAMWTERLPDPTALAAPMAAASLGVVTILGGTAGEAPQPVVLLPAVTEVALPAAGPLPAEEPDAPVSVTSGPAVASSRAEPPVSAPSVVDSSAPVLEGGPARVYVGPEQAREVREESSELPTFVELGPVFAAGNVPGTGQDAVQATLDQSDSLLEVLR